MNYILFDSPVRNHLLPFTYTRPVADIRVGILTIREKWEKHLGVIISTITEDYLKSKFPTRVGAQNIFINASYLPTKELVAMVKNLSENEAIVDKQTPIAFCSSDYREPINIDYYKQLPFEKDHLQIKNATDIFSLNDKAILLDFSLLTEGRTGMPIPENIQTEAKENIFIESGASLKTCALNASEGPIYIGKNAQVMEYAAIRGPFAMGEHTVVKMGTKIYGATTLGPHSKVGGELKNVVLMGYTNKGHDGYLGNAVVGQWCNLGAGTNNSNLKNNYTEVKLWNYQKEQFVKTGLQFCGLLMGDHSKCAINTMFNTGTVIGVGANIFGSGFSEKFIPSFSWAGDSELSTYQLEKFLQMAITVMRRRNLPLDKATQTILSTVFKQTSKYREK